MQQLIINRKQFPPQAEQRAKDWGLATTRRHKWVTGCSQHRNTHTHVHNETRNPVRISHLCFHSSSCWTHLSLCLVISLQPATHPACDCVFSSTSTLSRGQASGPQPSCLCFKVISDLSIWGSKPQAAPAEGSRAKQWPFHGECDSYISAFARQHAVSGIR